MRFAFISTMEGWQWGGSEELWTRAAVQLHREGHRVRASVPYWPELSPKFTSLREKGVALETHVSRHASLPGRVWNKFSRADTRSQYRLLHFRPDLVVISQGHNSGGFEWARFCRDRKLPYVIIVQCNSELWWFGKHLEIALEAYRGALRIYGVSKRNIDLLQLQLGEPLPNSEIARNPWNVEMDGIPPWPDEDAGWKLACVARLEVAAKGQDILLQSMAKPEWRSRPCEVSLFGTGKDDEALRRMASMLQLQNVHFRGNVSDIGSVWRTHHLLVLPSRHEGLPLALVEAMWSARPSVTTDVGGNSEFCIEGQTGFVAAGPTLPGFSAALERAWESRGAWRQIGQAARRFVEERIPEDPIAVFCRKLELCVNPSGQAAHEDKVMTVPQN